MAGENRSEDAQKHDALLVNLILIFKNAALQQMGKIINPITGEVDRNLEQARFSIDMIGMLKEKTKGNIPDEIDKLVGSTLLELRLNYVEELEKQKKEEAEEAKPEEPGEKEEAKTGEDEKESKVEEEPTPKASGRATGKKPKKTGRKKGGAGARRSDAAS